MEGFNLNDLTLISRHFGILVMVMATMIGMLYFFLKKNWILSKDLKLNNKDEINKDDNYDVNNQVKKKGKNKILNSQY
jgi:hypothetical protein